MYETVASTYPAGHPVNGVPAGPFGPYFATTAYPAVVDGALINCAPLELTAYELVDGIPNGKNIFTNNPYKIVTFEAVTPGGPIGPV